MKSAVIVSIRVAATPAQSFDVFTQEIALWWKSSGLFQATPRGDGELRFEGGEGGRLATKLTNGKTYEIGRILAWEPGALLRFTWRPPTFTPEQTTEVEVQFEAVDSQTRVTVTHRGWTDIPREHVARHGFPDGPFLQRTAEWWRAHLNGFAARFGETP